jgi:hypothetical protein
MTFPPVFLGTTVETLGVGLLAWATYTERTATVYGMMSLVGCGIGLRTMAAPLHGLGIFRNHRAAVVSLLAVAIPFGGTLGLTIMSSVFNNVSGLDSSEDSFAQDLPAEAQERIVHQAKMGVMWAFVAVTPLMVSVRTHSFHFCRVLADQKQGWVCVLFLGNVRLSKKTTQEGEAPSDSDVMGGVYLWALVSGRRAVDEEKHIQLMAPTAGKEVATPRAEEHDAECGRVIGRSAGVTCK